MRKSVLFLFLLACLVGGLLVGCAGDDGTSLATLSFVEGEARGFFSTSTAFDSDLDGVPDAEEKVDGTDPRDPSSARAWHPYDLPDFPRLIADQDRWNSARAEVLAGTPVYRHFYEQAIAQADRIPLEPQASDYDADVALFNAEVARAVAVRFWAEGDPADAAKASAILRQTDPNFEVWTYKTLDHGGILVSHALILMCQAYEILIVEGGFGTGEAKEAADVIQQLAVSFHDFYARQFPLWLMATRNNHNVRFDSSLGYVAMTINNWPEAARLVNFGLTEAIHWQLIQQNCAGEGCVAEGPDYLAYSAQNFLPFFLAYHRFAQGRSFPYMTSCSNHVPGLCREEVITVKDPADDARLNGIFSWWLHLRLPNGFGAPLDDSNLHCLPMGLVSILTGDGRFRWAFEEGSACTYSAGANSWEQLLLLPDLPAAIELTEEDLFYINEPAGQAVIRSEIAEDSSYLLLNAEHGVARTHGMGHEQPDNISFMLAALGEFFFIDSGYISYDERARTAGPENHNVILVDGQGAWRGINGFLSDVPGYLTAWQRDAEIAWVVAEATYANTAFTRFAGLASDGYFVMADRTVSDGVHEFDWLGHVNAGGTTDGDITLADGGAVISRPTADLRVFVQASVGPSQFTLAEDEHGLQGGAQTHAVLHATVQAESPVFLSLFFPVVTDADLPALYATYANGELAMLAVGIGDEVVLWAAAHTGVGIHLNDAGQSLPLLDSDADLAMVRYDPTTNTVIEVWRQGGTYLDVSFPVGAEQ